MCVWCYTHTSKPCCAPRRSHTCTSSVERDQYIWAIVEIGQGWVTDGREKRTSGESIIEPWRSSEQCFVSASQQWSRWSVFAVGGRNQKVWRRDLKWRAAEPKYWNQLVFIPHIHHFANRQSTVNMQKYTYTVVLYGVIPENQRPPTGQLVYCKKSTSENFFSSRWQWSQEWWSKNKRKKTKWRMSANESMHARVCVYVCGGGADGS